MYDSVSELLEQQQKFTDLFNKIYTPELLRMQQICSELTKQLQLPVSDALLSLSKTSTLLRESTQSFQTDKFLSEWNRTMEINKQLTQSMSSVWKNTEIERLTSVLRQIALPTETIQNMQIDLFTGYGEIVKRLTSLSENEIEFIVDGTDFTAKEVLEDINELKETDLVSENGVLEHDSLLLKEKWDNFLKQHPALANTIWIIGVFIGLISGIFAVNELGELVVSTTQEVIVKMQGNEDIFFIDVEAAKLYTEPNGHSAVITKILYAEEVTQIDSVKMWDKVIYINPDGEEITGWIAKRNLMPYRDYQFNSDDLYDIESEIVFEYEEEEYKEGIKESDCSENAGVQGVSVGNTAKYAELR